jgi:RHS repeat-associated protein
MDGLGSLSYNTATNRITSGSFAYDAAGNQTQSNENGQINNYKYDAAGRLAEVTSGGLTHTYAYGASNQRLEMVEAGAQGSTTLYAWAGGQVIAEYNGVGSGMAWTKSYVYLGGRLLATDSTSGIQYHHPDRLGTRLVTNTSGGVVSENLHLPFGTTITGESNNLAGSDSKKRFTSYDRSDNTKLDYAVNRHYSAAQGRFTQVDPIGMSAVSLENPQSLNLYAYCFNDPVNHVDPEGLFIDAGAGGALGGVVGAIIGAVLGALRVIFGGRGPRTRMGARLEQRLAPVETGSSGDWEEPTVETGVGAVATQVKARPKLRPRQHRKKKPPNKGGEGGKSTSVIAGGATVVAAAVVVASAVSRIDCNVIRALISLEQQLGTRLASVEAVWGNNPINNIPGKLAYNGKSLDLDWYVKVRSKMQGGIVPTSLDVNVVYFGGKSLWGVTKVVWWAIAVSSGAFPPGTEIPLTPTLTSIPYVDAGEREAIKLLSRNLRYSQIFNEQWMKENCNSK